MSGVDLSGRRQPALGPLDGQAQLPHQAGDALATHPIILSLEFGVNTRHPITAAPQLKGGLNDRL